MRFNPIKQAFAIGLVILMPLCLHAEQEIRSSFRIQMPQSLAHGKSKLLESSYNIDHSSKIENFTLDSKYPTWSENIDLTVNLNLSPLNIWSFSKPQTFETINFSAKVRIGKTTTEYTEVRQSAGSSITIDLKAQCSDINLELNDQSAQLSGLITIHNMGNNVKLELNKTNMNWAPESWKISPFHCEGITGFERLAKREIQDYLNSPQSLQDKIFNEIKKEIINLETDINSRIFKIHKLDTPTKNFLVNFEPQLLLPHKETDDFRFDGVTNIRFRGLSLKRDQSKPLFFNGDPTPSPHRDGPTFTFPVSIIEPMIENLFSNGNLNESWSSNELEGFSDFMNSDSQRRHAWPEMLRYNSKSNFKFQAHVIKKPTVRDIKNSGERIEMWVKSTLVIQMFAPTSEGYVPYTEWIAPLDAHVSIQVFKGGFWYKVLNDSKFSWSAKFSQKYIERYKPEDTDIDAKRIGASVIEALIKKQYRIAIPNWKISDNIEYRAEKMFRTETLLWIYWNEFKN